MKSNKNLGDIVMTIYKEMYKKADPPADIDKLIKEGVTLKPNWFRNYYLPEKEFDEIYNRICKKNRLTSAEKTKISFEIYLGAGPSSVRPSGWDEEEN